MSEAMQEPGQTGGERTADKQTPDEIVADIDATRDRIAGNLDALTEKLDVKAHAQEAVHGAVADAKSTVASAAGSAAARSRTLVDRFRALPLAAQAAIGAGATALVVTLIVRSARS